MRIAVFIQGINQLKQVVHAIFIHTALPCGSIVGWIFAVKKSNAQLCVNWGFAIAKPPTSCYILLLFYQKQASAQVLL
jgi:hypothetical protein